MLRLLVFLLLFAAVVYAAFWLIDQRSQRNEGPNGPSGPRPAPRGPKGPDDDEDFLRELDRRRRHESGDSDS